LSADPIESATHGAVHGAVQASLEYGEQKAKEFATKLLNRKLAFIGAAANIELVKQQRKSTDVAILKPYMPSEQLILVQTGLMLRQIARNRDEVESLRAKITKKYGPRGLHIAEMTQVGIMTLLLTELSEIYREPSEVRKRLDYFLRHAEDYALFVKNSDKPDALVTMIVNRIESSEAHIMILFGCRNAIRVVYKVLRQLAKNSRHYPVDKIEDGFQIIAFIYTPELRARISRWAESFNVSDA
jgi:hypothetical protein